MVWLNLALSLFTPGVSGSISISISWFAIFQWIHSDRVTLALIVQWIPGPFKASMLASTLTLMLGMNRPSKMKVLL